MCRYFHVWPREPPPMTHLLSKNFPSSFQSFSPSNTNCLLGLSNWVSYLNHKVTIFKFWETFCPARFFSQPSLPVVGTSTRWVIGRKCAHGLWYPQGPWLPDSPVDCSCFPLVSPSFASYYETHCRIPAQGFISCPEMLLLSQASVSSITYSRHYLRIIHLESHL